MSINKTSSHHPYDHESIHTFALKYLALYRSSETTEREVRETFADECFDLGFEMDCGHKFDETYGSIQESFEPIADKVTDVAILASGIFSKWRYITHWAYCAHCLDPENREWFIAAFERLAELTAHA